MEKEISENKEKDQVKSEKENSKNDENNSSNNQENLEDNKKELTPEEEIDNLKDKLARTFAEMENQRRRFEKEREDAFEYGGFSFAKESLNLLDNLLRHSRLRFSNFTFTSSFITSLQLLILKFYYNMIMPIPTTRLVITIIQLFWKIFKHSF